MQTFLPYPSFAESVHCLDRARLGKQRAETLQILRTLRRLSDGWSAHPAVRMWRGYEDALVLYGSLACLEWQTRGYQDRTLGKILALMSAKGDSLFSYPPWFGDEAFHLSHRSNLLRKDPEHYSGLPGFDVPNDLPYIWPETKGDT